MITCGACHKPSLPAPVFVGDDGQRLDSVEETCTNCGQLWQFPNYPPAKILDRKLMGTDPEKEEPPEPVGHPLNYHGQDAELCAETLPPRGVVDSESQ